MVMDDTLGQTVSSEHNPFVVDGILQMKLVMEKFYQHYSEIYGNSIYKFVEKQGRIVFLLYLKQCH